MRVTCGCVLMPRCVAHTFSRQALKASEDGLAELQRDLEVRQQAWEFERQNLTRALEQANALAQRSSLPQMDSMPLLLDAQVRSGLLLVPQTKGLN